MLRIAVDLDGTICESKKPGQAYESVKPLPNAVAILNRLKDAILLSIQQEIWQLTTTT